LIAEGGAMAKKRFCPEQIIHLFWLEEKLTSEAF